MQDNLPASKFTALSSSELLGVCRNMANEATECAKRAKPSFRAAYTVLAMEWLLLADEIARLTMGSG
jgi:hypothetical protein